MKELFAHQAEFQQREAGDVASTDSNRDLAFDYLVGEIQVMEPDWLPPENITIDQLRAKLAWVMTGDY